MREKQDKPVDEMQGIPATPSNNTDNISRRNKLGIIITATALGLFFIAVIAMYVLSL